LQFTTPEDNQGIAFIITAVDGDVKDIRIEIDNYREIYFPITLKEGESIKYSKENTAMVCDKNWQKIQELSLDQIDISNGDHAITIDCDFVNGNEPMLKLEVRIPGEKILIKS